MDDDRHPQRMDRLRAVASLLLFATACGGASVSSTPGTGGTSSGPGTGGTSGDAGTDVGGGGGAGGAAGTGEIGGTGGSGASGGTDGRQSLADIVDHGAPTIATAPRPDFGAVAVIVANDGARIYAVESRRDVEPGPAGIPWRSRFRLA